jgi:hypothetical protein
LFKIEKKREREKEREKDRERVNREKVGQEGSTIKYVTRVLKLAPKISKNSKQKIIDKNMIFAFHLSGSARSSQKFDLFRPLFFFAEFVKPETKILLLSINLHKFENNLKSCKN